MYKRRIAQWGLLKNSRENEMRDLYEVERIRREGNRTPLQNFQIGTRQIPRAKAIRYFRRKGYLATAPSSQVLEVKVQNEFDGQFVDPDSNSEAQNPRKSSTASPEKISTLVTGACLNKTTPQLQQQVCLSNIRSIPADTMEHRIVERLLGNLGNYIHAFFESRPQRLDRRNIRLQTERVQRFSYLTREAKGFLLEANKFNEVKSNRPTTKLFRKAFKSLDQALDGVQQLILDDNPDFLFAVLQMIQELAESGQLLVLNRLLAFMSSMSDLYLSKTHPIRAILGAVARCETDMNEIAAVGLKKALSLYITTGYVDPTSLLATTKLCKSLSKEECFNHAVKRLDLLREAQEELYGHASIEVCFNFITLGDILIAELSYEDAFLLFMDLYIRGKDETCQDGEWVQYYALCRLGMIIRLQNDLAVTYMPSERLLGIPRQPFDEAIHSLDYSNETFDIKTKAIALHEERLMSEAVLPIVRDRLNLAEDVLPWIELDISNVHMAAAEFPTIARIINL
ncbi:hypothetical protein N431DRAFT_420526 [Stipitochalara longipes BDJ]|nr:hypothetical protein N431DRAFT_420526 [Stipitochalara longipes BDJ]